MRRMPALLSIAALLAGLLATVAGVAQAAPPPVTDTYRVLTYNTQLRTPFPGLINDEDRYGVDNVTRANAIADMILAGNAGGEYDIVALNEVFDEAPRSTLVGRLASEFPFFVMKLNGTDPDPPIEQVEDSGLMLFSRFPFVSMTNTGNDCYLVDALLKCVVAFHQYEVLAVHGDKVAAKGIGFVRIQNPNSGKQTDVYFTHLQAEDSAAAVDVRADQVTEAVTFITSWSGASGTADAIVAGDLNVTAGSPEWASLVLSASGFAGAGLFFDTWFRHMPPSDPGFSSDPNRNALAAGDSADIMQGKRLDYILFRHAASTLPRACIQHLTLERHFKKEFPTSGSPFIVDLSDHFPLAASIGKTAAQCAPVSTAPPGEGALPDPAEGGHPQNIVWRGGFQWFRYGTPGTYSFTVQNLALRNMVLDVFDAKDLSTPLVPFSGSNILVTPPCTAACAPSPPVVVDAPGPFFVRVRMQDPTTTGPYTYNSHLHQGASFKDAIVLAPFETLFQIQMSNNVVNPMKTVYYAIKQRALTSGARQKLTFNTSGHPATSMRITVFDANQNQFPGMVNPVAKAGTQTLATPAASPIPAAPQKMFFTVDRLACLGGCPPGTYSVNWTTDYRNLDVEKFWIMDSNDTLDSAENDEVTCAIGIDSLGVFPVIFGSVGEGGARYFPALFRDIGFTTAVSAQCIEVDGNVNDPTITQSVTAGDIDASDPFAKVLKYMVFEDGGPGTDGLYRISVRGHRTIQP